MPFLLLLCAHLQRASSQSQACCGCVCLACENQGIQITDALRHESQPHALGPSSIQCTKHLFPPRKLPAEFAIFNVHHSPAVRTGAVSNFFAREAPLCTPRAAPMIITTRLICRASAPSLPNPLSHVHPSCPDWILLLSGNVTVVGCLGYEDIDRGSQSISSGGFSLLSELQQ